MELSVWVSLIHVENQCRGSAVAGLGVGARGFSIDEVANADSGIQICLRASSAKSLCPGSTARASAVNARRVASAKVRQSHFSVEINCAGFQIMRAYVFIHIIKMIALICN